MVAHRRLRDQIQLREPLAKTRKSAIPPITINRDTAVALHQQIRQQIADAIERGILEDGARLPSSRRLASMLGVSRNTALAAYEELVADGLVQARRGAGVRASGRSLVPAFSVSRIFRDAQLPTIGVAIADPDGTTIRLNSADDFESR